MGTIGDLARSVQYGSSAKAGDAGEWPILRMGNLTDEGRLDLGDLKYIDFSPSEVSKFTVQQGDLLFNRTNSREKVGKAAVVMSERPMGFAGYLVRVRFRFPSDAHFVSAYLRSPHGRARRLSLAKSAVNQANINATEMRGIPIAQPPRHLVERFAESAESLESRRNSFDGQTLDALFASLQARAFKGEL